MSFDFGGIFGGLAGLAASMYTTDRNITQANRTLDTQMQWRAEDYANFLENREATWNREDTIRNTERNLQWNREDAIRNELYGREDTSYQRTVADAKAAGLSPLSVSQLSAAGNPVVSSSAGSGTSSFSPPVSSQMPASYMAQSPAQDIATLVGAVLSQNNLDEMKRHNMATEAQASRELEFQTNKTNAELLQQAQQFDERLNFDKSQSQAQTNQFMLTYQQNASQFAARLAQDTQFHLDDLKGKALDRALDDMHSINKQNYDSAVDFAKSLDMPYVLKYYTNDDDYNKAMSDLKSVMIKGNRKVTNDILSNPEKYLSVDSASHSESQNNGVSAGAGGNNASSNSMSTLDKGSAKTVVDKVSDTLSRGFNVNASAQKGSSQSDSYSLSKSDRALQQEIQKLYGSVLEIPMRVYGWKDYEKRYSNYK